jgi:predicted PurR-regulated permease PerM
VIIGTILFGVPGAFLALPIAASLPTVMHYFNKA